MPELRMPSLGADMDAGTLVEWKVKPGDHVAKGAIVALIETQKATMEMESFVDGVVDSLVIQEGTKVPVGTVLATLRPNGSQPVPVPVPVPVPLPLPEKPTPPTRAAASPAARKLARERGVDLSSVHGTGPHGAIVLHDVPLPLPLPLPLPPSEKPTPPAPAPTTSSIRDAIASAMSRSKREIPHYYLSHTISLKRALAFLASLNSARAVADRILPNVLLLRAVVRALWDVPELNGTFTDGAFHPAEATHLGTAIALRTGGVIAPAILDADDKSLDQLMTELRDLVARARAGRLRSSEMTSATITVTSLGDRGCEAVWPVINPPQVAMVGFGAIQDRPWADHDEVTVHPTVVATLAADHRVSDGHRGGLFLHALDVALQSPEHL